MARKHDRYDGQRVGFAENARDLAKQHPRGAIPHNGEKISLPRQQ
jgi:hypothetical protein